MSSNINSIYGVPEAIYRLAVQSSPEILRNSLEEAKDKNGYFSNLWDDVKNYTGFGAGSLKCDEAIEAYKKGEIDFEEADKQIKEYAFKQEGSLNLFSNIAASTAALGVTALSAAAVTASCGAAAVPLVLTAIAAGTGALVKSGFKLLDRAGNKIDGDALDAKQIVKDSLSGAVTGGIAAVTMGTAASAPTVKAAIASCAETGVKTGAVSCGANYAIDCALDENKDFNAKDFALTAAEGAAVGGAVGAIMGGANASAHASGLLKSGCNFKQFIDTSVKTTYRDTAANSLCTTEYKIVNDRLRSSINCVLKFLRLK